MLPAPSARRGGDVACALPRRVAVAGLPGLLAALPLQIRAGVPLRRRARIRGGAGARTEPRRRGAGVARGSCGRRRGGPPRVEVREGGGWTACGGRWKRGWPAGGRDAGGRRGAAGNREQVGRGLFFLTGRGSFLKSLVSFNIS
uniref:Uncharacterized protein n=1 Tax=Setaria viridis TaxID=4556 RepID=A0A4U6V8Q1_SETVI|nr:hypothetical protein SEVIR_3G078166v2 [Setaria viridis]